VDANDRRLVFYTLRLTDRAFDTDKIIPVAHLLNVPARRHESLRLSSVNARSVEPSIVT